MSNLLVTYRLRGSILLEPVLGRVALRNFESCGGGCGGNFVVGGIPTTRRSEEFLDMNLEMRGSIDLAEQVMELASLRFGSASDDALG